MNPICFSIVEDNCQFFVVWNPVFFPKSTLISFQRMNYNPLCLQPWQTGKPSFLPQTMITQGSISSLFLLFQGKGTGMLLSLANQSFSPELLNSEQFTQGCSCCCMLFLIVDHRQGSFFFFLNKVSSQFSIAYKLIDERSLFFLKNLSNFCLMSI